MPEAYNYTSASVSELPASPPAAGAGEGALSPYVRAVRAHRLLFALVVLAALAGAVAWVTLGSPEYKSTARLLVTPLPQDDRQFLGFELLRDSGDPTRTVQTAAGLIESRQAADRTAQVLGSDWTGKKVEKHIQVNPEGESNIVTITGTDDSSKGSARLANTYVKSALSSRRKALDRQITFEIDRLRSQGTNGARTRIGNLQALRERGDPTLSQAQKAVAPDEKSGPPAPVVVVLALIAGLAIGTGAAVILELTAERIREEEDAIAIYPLPVLARLPHLPGRKRKPPKGAVGWFMPPQIREGFRTLVVQLEREQEERVLMIMSASTADGKTTSSVNLAASLAAAGHRVVLMDLDLRKPDVARTLGMRSEHALTNLVDPQATLAGLVRPAPGFPSLSVLATGAARPGDYALVEALARRLPELIAEARQSADYVVIDTAPLGEVSDALRFADEADDILLVTRMGKTKQRNLEMVRELLDRAGKVPRGFVLIGAVPVLTSGYYGYGIPQRRLLIGRRSDGSPQ
jgi:capsular exopolysaccharide synthesis family protein